MREAQPGTWWPLAPYTLLSLLLFGIPVLRHFSTHVVASDALDSSAYMWFFAWWPHALLHGLNPFVTHAMFVPDGFNLTWSAAMPGVALLLTPVTELFGPSATWNVIQLASPALSAWTMYLLAREITGSLATSLIAGYVFGFAPSMLLHLTGAPSLALVALLPVVIRLVLRRLRGAISPRRFVASTALALTAQLLTSTEVLATATIFGGLAYVIAIALYRERRPALLRAAALLAAAYAIAAVLVSPLLYFFFFGHQYPPGATFFPADLAAFVLPPSLVAIAYHNPPYIGSNSEPYLGLPLISLILAWTWTERRRRRTWLIVTPMLAAALCSLGRTVIIRGHITSIPGVWRLLAHLPILRYAIPVRLSLFVVTGAAVIVALFLAGNGTGFRAASWWRWALAALAIASVVPDVGSSSWRTIERDPAFFASGQYHRYLRASDNVLTVPVWGPNERWQADTGFAFNLSAGYAGNPFPPAYSRYPSWGTLLSGRLTPDYAAQIRRFVHDKRVTAIVVDATAIGPWRALFAPLGVTPVQTGGVSFYRLRG